MREAGDGLHAQMNSMMGALQELKLLQVQTALESLDISGRPINRGIPYPASTTTQLSAASALGLSEKHESVQRPTMPEEPSTSPVPNDASDWTSSLMSRSRNRQPLVLGDNVFADLVGNWLDLPEVEREQGEQEARRKKRDQRTTEGGEDRPDTPFSLTTNIFKKFLRSVRPDRDKLLKERPGWMAPEMSEGDLFKRPKKAAPKVSKSSFYLPFWANGQQGKGRPCPHLAEKRQPLFDYNTAVWV
uniref:PAK4-inhibitor INKA2 n=1 Tax=Xiphophorus couchianus TaxID=32473 RepID=A0A3B5MFR7_9TELE